MAGIKDQLYIGGVPLGLNHASVEGFDRKKGYRWPAQPRVARPEALQFVGAGAETITVKGYIHPHFKGDAQHMEQIHQLADAGIPYIVLTGTGKVFGKYAITDVSENFKELMDDGRPKRVDYSITLTRYGNDQ